MFKFGEDFQRAKSDWLYPHVTLQNFWRGIGLFIVLAILTAVGQVLGGYLSYAVIYGRGFSQFFNDVNSGVPDALKASIIGMSPSAILVIVAAIYMMKFGRPGRSGSLPLQFPKLGWLGWIVVVVGFMVIMMAAFQGIFAALGIDPETYSPTGGLKDNGSSSGLVEKTMADLVHEPLLFLIALPGAFIAAPITEELIFRGFLFSAIATSRLGRVAAVVISSALWSLVHLGGAPVLFVFVIFVMGLILGTLLLRFGSLWVTIVCHAAWNLLTAAAIFGVGTNA